MRGIAFAVAALLVIAPTYAEPSLCSSSTGRSISVHGSSVVRLRPDRVTFSVGVQTRSPRVTDAFKANSARVNEVLAALKKKGVASEEIQTSSFDISTIAPEKARPRTFMVESLVTVTRSETTSVGELLQAAVDAGANQAGNLRFFVADVAGLRQRGLELAFREARSKAEALASQSKRPLGDVLCVSDEAGGGIESDLRGRLRSLGYVGAPNVEPGLEELTCTVSVVFELK